MTMYRSIGRLRLHVEISISTPRSRNRARRQMHNDLAEMLKRSQQMLSVADFRPFSAENAAEQDPESTA